MRILLRNPAKGDPLHLTDRTLRIGQRVAALPESEGVYYILAFKAPGFTPHIDDTRTAVVTLREYHHAKEGRAALQAAGYGSIIAVFARSDTGEEVLLVNVDAKPATGLVAEELDNSLKGQPNLDVLSAIVDWTPSAISVGAKTALLRGIVAHDCLAAMQLQLDLLTSALAFHFTSNPTPAWWPDFIAAQAKSAGLSRKGLSASLDEIGRHHDYITASVDLYLQRVGA